MKNNMPSLIRVLRMRFAFFCLLALLMLPFSHELHAEESRAYIPAIIEFEDRSELTDLEKEGGVVWRTRADMAIVLIPEHEASRMLKARRKGSTHRGRKMHVDMDVARHQFDASAMHLGVSLPGPYTGKGVVVGFCDIGFDPSHPNFFDADGNSRVKRLVAYDERAGVRTQFDHIVPMRKWGTDNSDKYHATHVAGILAGSCVDSPYCGMAPNADIVATTSTLYDVGLLMGIEDVIDYAKEVGRPAVVNLSVSDYLGPHDGSTIFNKYVDLLGQEAIICFSSGNNGNAANSYRITFSDSTPDWGFRVHSADWRQYEIYGATEIWSADSRPVGLSMLFFDDELKEAFGEFQVSDGDNEFSAEITADNNPILAKYFTGNVLVTGGVNPRNNRWSLHIEYDLKTDISTTENDWARYNIGFKINGAPGVHADMTCDSHYSRTVALKGYPLGGSDLSVTDLAVTPNVLCIGMYRNRNSEPLLDGSVREFNYTPLTVAPESSYGTLLDGTVLPHTVAPGYGMLSSISGKFTREHPETVGMMSASKEFRGNTYYWGNESGTSMSSPYVAGSIACWLEADPTLTIAKVKEVIAATNILDVPNPGDPHHGCGWFNPYEGLKLVVKSAAVTDIAADIAAPRISVVPDAIEILNPAATCCTLSIHSVDGRSMMPSFSTSLQCASVSTDRLPAGTYVLTLAAEGCPVQNLKIMK